LLFRSRYQQLILALRFFVKQADPPGKSMLLHTALCTNSNENLRSIMDYWALRSIVAVDGGGMTPELRRVATDLDLEFWRI
jgi:hypothetical protein